MCWKKSHTLMVQDAEAVRAVLRMIHQVCLQSLRFMPAKLPGLVARKQGYKIHLNCWPASP